MYNLIIFLKGQEARTAAATGHLEQAQSRQDQVPVRRALLSSRPRGVHPRVLPAQPGLAASRAAHQPGRVRVAPLRQVTLLPLPP